MKLYSLVTWSYYRLLQSRVRQKIYYRRRRRCENVLCIKTNRIQVHVSTTKKPKNRKQRGAISVSCSPEYRCGLGTLWNDKLKLNWREFYSPDTTELWLLHIAVREDKELEDDERRGLSNKLHHRRAHQVPNLMAENTRPLANRREI